MSKSIKLIHFNEADCIGEQGYQLPSYSNINRIPMQVIKVEKTLIKPKFGFKCEEDYVETEEAE